MRTRRSKFNFSRCRARLSQLFSSFLTFTTNLKKFPTDGSRKKRPKELNLDRLGNIINNNKFNNKIIHNFDFQCRYSTLINQVSLFSYKLYNLYLFFIQMKCKKFLFRTFQIFKRQMINQEKLEMPFHTDFWIMVFNWI